MLNPDIPKPTRMNPDYGKAVLDRGLSFIAAARLIAENAGKDIKKIDELENIWKEPLGGQDLHDLQAALINLINETVYQNRKDFKEVKNELDNAENHMNWKKRDTVESTVNFSDQQVDVKRKELPISEFTEEQTQEWLKILNKNKSEQPEWFKILPLWEQNYLKKKIYEWDKLHRNENLGIFLGPVPTTIRRYPGAPNAYHTEVDIGDLKFNKIRSGVLAPVKMAASKEAEKIEKVKITEQNLEQLVVEAIKLKLATLQKEGKKLDNNNPIDLPILLQTLYSPPNQPPGKYNNKAMELAVRNMRSILKDENKLNELLQKNGITDDIKGLNIKLLFSNRPVNRARNISKFLKPLYSTVWIVKQNYDTTSYYESLLKKQPNQIANAALEAYKNLDKMAEYFVAFRPKDVNIAAEKAALEQIIASQLGVRVGSCVSGKDREEMITELSIAQMAFYQKYNRFPPPYNPKASNDERIEFETMVAKLYLEGHGHKLAAANAAGCDGLKNIVDVFGKRICNKIIDLAPQYGINPEVFNPVKGCQQIANLNKLKVKNVFDEKNQQSEQNQSNIQVQLSEILKTPSTTEKSKATAFVLPDVGKILNITDNNKDAIAQQFFVNAKALKNALFDKSNYISTDENSTNQMLKAYADRLDILQAMWLKVPTYQKDIYVLQALFLLKELKEQFKNPSANPNLKKYYEEKEQILNQQLEKLNTLAEQMKNYDNLLYDKDKPPEEINLNIIAFRILNRLDGYIARETKGKVSEQRKEIANNLREDIIKILQDPSSNAPDKLEAINKQLGLVRKDIPKHKTNLTRTLQKIAGLETENKLLNICNDGMVMIEEFSLQAKSEKDFKDIDARAPKKALDSEPVPIVQNNNNKPTSNDDISHAVLRHSTQKQSLPGFTFFKKTNDNNKRTPIATFFTAEKPSKPTHK